MAQGQMEKYLPIVKMRSRSTNVSLQWVWKQLKLDEVPKGLDFLAFAAAAQFGMDGVERWLVHSKGDIEKFTELYRRRARLQWDWPQQRHYYTNWITSDLKRAKKIEQANGWA